MWFPARSKIGRLDSGGGNPAKSRQTSRIQDSHRDQLFSSTNTRASRASGMPVHPGCSAEVLRRTRPIDTKSE